MTPPPFVIIWIMAPCLLFAAAILNAAEWLEKKARGCTDFDAYVEDMRKNPE
jgi:hypothetical protein